MQRREEVKFGGAAVSLSADLSCLQGCGGGAEREAALASLEKQLICPICLEIFNKPVVILPCQHNLCRKCANELYQPSLFQARTTMMVNSGRFRCPSCRHEVVLDRHGVYGLQRNLLVENIIDVYKQEVSNITAVTSPPPPPPPVAQVTCSDHEGEKVNIYCLTCQVPTCSLCKVFGAHQSCQVAPLTDVCQQQKDRLAEGVSSLVAFNDKLQALIDEVEETCRVIEENSKIQKQSVSDRFSHMFAILEERSKAMSQQISSEQEEKTGHIQTLLRRYGDSVETNSKLMESAASSMEEPDMAAFVQNSGDLITKVIAATSSCPCETLRPGYDNLTHYSFNFSDQERALRSIDFIRAEEDVSEEPEPEPEEPTEPLIQDTEPKEFQNQEAVADPVKDQTPDLISPLEEPVQTADQAEPEPEPVRDSVAPPAEALQPETEDQDADDVRSAPKEAGKEEEEEGQAGPHPVKEGHVCEEEGMSTLQCEGGQADRKDGAQVEDGVHAEFYPSWFKAGSWSRVSTAASGQMMCSPPPLQLPQSDQNQESPEPGLTEEEEEEMQGWVCLPVDDKAFSLAEGIFDLGEDGFSEGCTSSVPPEETDGGFSQTEDSELKDADMKERPEDAPGLREEEGLKKRGEEEAVEAGPAAEAAGSSGFKGDSSMNPNKETSEEETKSSASLQAVTLIFYLLAFLVILQRVWAYIGCFIIT